MTAAEHLRAAAQLRQLIDNPKAQELAMHHEELAPNEAHRRTNAACSLTRHHAHQIVLFCL